LHCRHELDIYGLLYPYWTVLLLLHKCCIDDIFLPQGRLVGSAPGYFLPRCMVNDYG